MPADKTDGSVAGPDPPKGRGESPGFRLSRSHSRDGVRGRTTPLRRGCHLAGGVQSLDRDREVELLSTLELPDFQRAAAIGKLWASPKRQSLGELLIDAEEDRRVRALLIGMLKERQGGGWQY